MPIKHKNDAAEILNQERFDANLFIKEKRSSSETLVLSPQALRNTKRNYNKTNKTEEDAREAISEIIDLVTPVKKIKIKQEEFSPINLMSP